MTLVLALAKFPLVAMDVHWAAGCKSRLFKRLRKREARAPSVPDTSPTGLWSLQCQLS